MLYYSIKSLHTRRFQMLVCLRKKMLGLQGESLHMLHGQTFPGFACFLCVCFESVMSHVDVLSHVTYDTCRVVPMMVCMFPSVQSSRDGV